MCEIACVYDTCTINSLNFYVWILLAGYSQTPKKKVITFASKYYTLDTISDYY